MIMAIFLILVLTSLFVGNTTLSIIVLIVCGILMVIFSTNQKEVRTNIVEENKRRVREELKDFVSDTTKTVGMYSFLINTKEKIIAIRYKGKMRTESPILLNINNVSKVELLQDDVIIKSNAMDRAIVGGIIAGGVGAIVGSNTAKQETQINNIVLKFTTKDINNPLMKIKLYEKSLAFDEGINHTTETICNDAEEFIAMFDILKNN